MSISNERFAAEGLHLTYDPYEPTERRIAVFQMQCRSCGYEPEDDSEVKYADDIRRLLLSSGAPVPAREWTRDPGTT